MSVVGVRTVAAAVAHCSTIEALSLSCTAPWRAFFYGHRSLILLCEATPVDEACAEVVADLVRNVTHVRSLCVDGTCREPCALALTSLGRAAYKLSDSAVRVLEGVLCRGPIRELILSGSSSSHASLCHFAWSRSPSHSGAPMARGGRRHCSPGCVAALLSCRNADASWKATL